MNETMISKHDMIDVDGVWLLKAGRTYETSDCPTTHTPNLEIGPQLVIVTCEDGKDSTTKVGLQAHLRAQRRKT